MSTQNLKSDTEKVSQKKKRKGKKARARLADATSAGRHRRMTMAANFYRQLAPSDEL